MKNLVLGLITFSFAASSGAKADLLGTQDDLYLGLQIIIPLDFESSAIRSKSNRLSLLLLQQTEGIRDGFAFTLHGNGVRELIYIRPSSEFEIGGSRLAGYAVPLVTGTSPGEGEPGQRLGSWMAVPMMWLAGLLLFVD